MHEVRKRSIVRRCVEREVGDDWVRSRREVPRDRLLSEAGVGVTALVVEKDVTLLVAVERVAINFDQFFDFLSLPLEMD